MSFIHEWSFKILTLSVSSVESHTADSLHRFVKSVLAAFIQNNKRVIFFNTMDAAVNMKLLSKLLGYERLNCVAHSLHLLLTVDPLFKVSDLCDLVRKCKDIVST